MWFNMGMVEEMESLAWKVSATIVWQQRKFWVFEVVKITHTFLRKMQKINLKKKKIMKIFCSKFPKFICCFFFCISKLFIYFYQRNIIHNIGMCYQNLQRVLWFLTHCWSHPNFDSSLQYWKKVSVGGWCCSTCQHN